MKINIFLHDNNLHRGVILLLLLPHFQYYLVQASPLEVLQRVRNYHYASTDAWTCIKLYERLHELKHSGNYELVVAPPKVKPVPDNTGSEAEVTTE